jgi:alkaline phosphatase D
MHLTRRAFLKLAGQAGLAVPFALGPFGCAMQIARGFDADTGLWLGCVAGDVTPDGAVVWLRAEAGDAVSLQYGREPNPDSFASTESAWVASESDYTARIVLSGLDPATTYYYRAAVAGKRPGPIARFLTAPAPDDLAVVKFCFGGDTRESYKPFTIMDAVRVKQPDFFIHLGDTIYADRGGAASELSEFWAKYRGNRDDAASQRLFAETSVYVIWDDHEVEDNYEGHHPLAAIGWRAFFDYWPVRRNAAEPDRIYRSFRWGKALEFFLLDTRQYRDHAQGTMLGAQQKEWLFDSLAASSAIFKIIGTGVPFYGGGRDRWDGYPRERAEVLRWIKEKNIKGVVFISADLHSAAVTRIRDLRRLKEIGTGPLAAPLNAFGIGYSTRSEFFSNKAFNYGMITIDPTSSPPRMLVEILDEKNESLYKSTIDAV